MKEHCTHCRQTVRIARCKYLGICAFLIERIDNLFCSSDDAQSQPPRLLLAHACTHVIDQIVATSNENSHFHAHIHINEDLLNFVSEIVPISDIKCQSNNLSSMFLSSRFFSLLLRWVRMADIHIHLSTTLFVARMPLSTYRLVLHYPFALISDVHFSCAIPVSQMANEIKCPTICFR